MSHFYKEFLLVSFFFLLFARSEVMAQSLLKSQEDDTNETSKMITTETKTVINNAQQFYTQLKEYDLNKETQYGFSITLIEYERLMHLWQNLCKKARILILSGFIDKSLSSTFAQFLVYAINKDIQWAEVIDNLNRMGAKGSALTLSNVKGLVTLEMVYKSLLDLLYKSKNKIVDGKLCIDADIKFEAGKRISRRALDRLEKWEKLLNDIKNFSNHEKVKYVNDFFNNLITASADNYDYWQSPIETLLLGKGDCEDFTIAKYISLRILGIPENQLLIAIVRLAEFAELHAVLLYYPYAEDDPWVMDNLSYYNGNFKSHLIRMSYKILHYNIDPLLGFNEMSYVEYGKGMKKHYLDKNPVTEIPMFAIALNNSKSMLQNVFM